jgi:hypothetical protein
MEEVNGQIFNYSIPAGSQDNEALAWIAPGPGLAVYSFLLWFDDLEARIS